MFRSHTWMRVKRSEYARTLKMTEHLPAIVTGFTLPDNAWETSIYTFNYFKVNIGIAIKFRR